MSAAVVKPNCLHIASMIALGWLSAGTHATNLTVINPGFEDVSGQDVFNEFTFGEPAGWNLHDPNNVIPDGGTFTGTLEPNGIDFFNTTAPEGNKVGILFNSGREGEGEYGYVQTLAEMLQANTAYSFGCNSPPARRHVGVSSVSQRFDTDITGYIQSSFDASGTFPSHR